MQSNPLPGSVVDSAPRQVTLIFSEPVIPAGAGIKAFGPSGQEVAGPVRAQGRSLASPLSTYEIGTYVVTWQVIAADTHPSRGAFAYSVRRPGPNPYLSLLDVGQAGTSTPSGLALQALARAVHFAGFALAFGFVAYAALARRPPGHRRLVTSGVLLLLAAEPLALIAQLASLTFDWDTSVTILGSNFGRLLGLRLGAALLTWALLATARSWPILLIGAVDAVLDGLSGHAIPELPGAGPLVVAIHVAAMGMWVGGLTGYVLALDHGFTRYAIWTLGVAVASGLVLAFAHTHFGSQLLTSDYGRALLAKALLVVAAIAAAALGRHRRELALAALVIAAAALVAALPPPY